MAYVNLRQYASDGSMAKWPRDLRHALVDPPTAFLGSLERAFGHQFTFRELPQGYAVFRKARNDTTSRGYDLHIYGHPVGHFLSAPEFSHHVRWLMQGRAGRCRCVRCRQGYRKAPRAARRLKPPPPPRFWQIPKIT